MHNPPHPGFALQAWLAAAQLGMQSAYDLWQAALQPRPLVRRITVAV
jgi:plasmid maintenance system antidote protein VapI